jgi:arylsulfatase A-like enzyme
MLTGYSPAAHGVSWNDGWYPDRRLRVPSVFALARRAGFRTVLVAGKGKFRQFDEPGCLDAFVLAEGDVAVANAAVVQSQAGFDLMFVHLGDVDGVGHRFGWMSASYLKQVAETDRALGRIVQGLPPGTTVILTADHGGNGRGHGEDRPEDMLIPWIIAGPGVFMGHTLSSQLRITTVDTAATALYVLGIALPADAAGRPVLAAFRSSEKAALGLTSDERLLQPLDDPEAGVPAQGERHGRSFLQAGAVG